MTVTVDDSHHVAASRVVVTLAMLLLAGAAACAAGGWILAIESVGVTGRRFFGANQSLSTHSSTSPIAPTFEDVFPRAMPVVDP